MKKFGIDLSYWQKKYPYSKAKAEGVDFVIIRAGYGTTKDSEFETHYSKAKAMGWGVGAYWYLYAKSPTAAKAEAKAFLAAIKGKKFEYPVYLDLEDPSLKGLGKATLDAMVKAFGETIEDAGYYFGVYTNLDWYRNKISGAALSKKYDWWIAAWIKTCPIDCGLWQFGGETNVIRSVKVGGVTTDQNYAFIDYPAIIKKAGLNGYGKPTAEKKPDKPAAEKKPDKPAAEKKPEKVTIGIKKGSRVRVKQGAKDMNTGGRYSDFVYKNTYTVISITGSRVVFGVNGTATGAVNKADLKLV